MKANVTLVNPPYPGGVAQAIFIPLGISYLAAVLESNNYEVNVIDCQVHSSWRDKLAKQLGELKPDIVGVTSATLTYEPAVEVTKIAKKILPDCLTLMGGPHVTVMDEQSLRENEAVDVIVRGEGEQTLLEIASLVSEADIKNLVKVPGITFRAGTKIIKTVDRPFIQDIDSLPYPAHKKFQVNRYSVFGKTYLPIITSRGCPYNCAFCLASKMCGQSFRARSPSNVVNELEWLRDVYNVDAFAFYDDTFTFDRKRALAICEEIKRRKINLPWDCRTRVDRVSKYDLQKMKSAGCELVHFGVESGTQKILNAMKKGTTVEQNALAIKWAKEAGISAAISLVFGYPGETIEDLEQTLNFIRKTKPDYVYICIAVAYPGTHLYDLVKSLGWKLSEKWSDYHEQTQVFYNPLLSLEKIEEKKKAFYNEFFSPAYFLRKSMKKDFYSQTMARTALNHLLWRIKMPWGVSSTFKKIIGKQKSQGGHAQPTKKAS